jgi:Zn-finger nucleic acid-binding protein
MGKELLKGSASFCIDKCPDCELVWFDAGELARLQLDYEATPREREATRFQDRHRQMNPEEKRQFEQHLARLPEGDATLASAFGQGLMESMRNVTWALRRQ